MTLKSQLKIECRQTRDTVGALLDFVSEQRNIAVEHRALLSFDLDRALIEIPELDRAVDKPPAIALLAPVSPAGDLLVATLAGVRDKRASGLVSGGAVRLPILSGLLPVDDELGLSALVRLTHDAPGQAAARAAETVGRMMGPQPDGPRRAPDNSARITVLGLPEVITILARAYLANVKSQGSAPTVADVVAAIERTSRDDVSTAGQAGLAAHQIAKIRIYLEQRYADHPRLAVLGAAGFWEAFASLAPRATSEGRRRLASLLWAGLGDFDTVYGELASALDRLNHASEVICAPDAIRAAQGSIGWGQAHPWTILAARTLLSSSDAVDELVEVRTRFGHPVTVARNILAALVREVTVSVEGEASSLLARTDIVQLPIACPSVVPRDTYTRPLELMQSDAAGDAAWLARALMQAKTLYLAETETYALGLTGMIVHLDATAPLPSQFAPIVAHWIEHTQGNSPQSREANDTTLFVAVDAPTAAATSPLAPLKDFLGDVPRMSNWLDRWGTETAFDNLFILGFGPRHAGTALTGSPTTRRLPGAAANTGTALATLATTDADSPEQRRWMKHVRDAAVAVDEALNSGDGGLVYLAQSVAAIDYARAKRRQISARLNDTSALLADAVDRLLYASAPDANSDWRHRAALATQARLRLTASEHRIGQLIDALAPSERQLTWLFERMAHDLATTAAADNGLLHRLAAIDRIDESSAERLADRYASRAISHWLHGMRVLAISPEGPQAFGFTEATFGHVIDELAIGAASANLHARIATSVTRILTVAPGSPSAQSSRAAMLANEVICSFLSHLGFDSPWSSRHPRRRGTLGAPLFERAAASGPEELATMQANRITLQYTADWCEGFGLMTEENIASARGMRFEESEFRELAELLSLLGANTRERTL